MANETKKLRLRRGDLKVLESWVRSRTLPRRQVERAQMLLAASHGESSRSIAEALGVARDTARLWIRRYGEGGLKSVTKDRERAGRPRKLTPALEEEIVAKTDLPPRAVPHPMLVPAPVEGREGRASSGTRATA